MDRALSQPVASVRGIAQFRRPRGPRTQSASVTVGQLGYTGKATRPAKSVQDLKDPAHLWASASMGRDVKVMQSEG